MKELILLTRRVTAYLAWDSGFFHGRLCSHATGILPESEANILLMFIAKSAARGWDKEIVSRLQKFFSRINFRYALK
jgi:hypothetical protein